MKTFLRAFALSLLLTSGACCFAWAEGAPPSAEAMFHTTTLDLAAEGEIRAAPDIATINLGVTSVAKSAAEALAGNAARMSQVITALQGSRITAKDTQTSGLSVSAQYAYEQNQPPRLTGYQASHLVTVTVRDLNRVGAVVDAAVSAGANQVNGISFGLSDPAAAENGARELAVRALQAKADLYARAIGYRVLRLVSLREGAGFAIPPLIPMASFAQRGAMADQTIVSPGELKLKIDVMGVYELSR